MAFLENLKQSLFYGYGYDGPAKSFYDSPRDYHNKKGNRIVFIHVPSGQHTWFPAFMTQFTETFNSSWKTDPVIGRSDHIRTFAGTTRQVQMAWQAPAHDAKNGIGNLKACGRLAQFLYPRYADDKNALSITEAPVIKVKFANLLQDSSQIQSQWPHAVEVIITSFTYEASPDAGFFDSTESSPGSGGRDRGVLIPKVIDCTCTMEVIHQHYMGWKKTKKGYRFATCADDSGKVDIFPHLPRHLANPNPEAAAAEEKKWNNSVNQTVAIMQDGIVDDHFSKAQIGKIRKNVTSWPYSLRDKFIFEVDQRTKQGLEKAGYTPSYEADPEFINRAGGRFPTPGADRGVVPWNSPIDPKEAMPPGVPQGEAALRNTRKEDG